ncbi:hypothetical protein [Dyadobacter sp. 676]|uniref:Uncharacterized protein n=1 Tax=Dyadobacter sp. 676 TaxID=3088362 RepID=A0AAU8FIJ3_9BACT
MILTGTCYNRYDRQPLFKSAIGMLLLQMFLPLYDNAGKQFPEANFLDLRQELTTRFGGVTIYSRSPVKGLWKQDESSVTEDEMVIYEVLVDKLDTSYWTRLKLRLQHTFRQEEIMMRYYEVTRL